jgi:transposase
MWLLLGKTDHEVTPMMGQQDKQLKMVLLDLSSMVPRNHLLQIIKEHIDFDFI